MDDNLDKRAITIISVTARMWSELDPVRKEKYNQ